MQWPAVHHLRSLELWVHLRLREKETDELKTGHFMAASTQYTYNAPLTHTSIRYSDFWSTNDANNWLCSIASRCSTKEDALLLRVTALTATASEIEHTDWLILTLVTLTCNNILYNQSTVTWMKCDSAIIVHWTPGHKSKHGTLQPTRLTNKEHQDNDKDQSNNSHRHRPHHRIQTVLLTGLFASIGGKRSWN